MNNHGNEACLIRTAEAFGINHVFVVGKRQYSYNISQGADRHMTFFEFETEKDIINYAQKNNHTIVCVENTPGAIDITDLPKYPVNPIFITGNEKHGVPEAFIKSADRVIKIPQSESYVRCLNTTTACSIVLNDWYQKRRLRDKQQYYENNGGSDGN